VDEHAGRFVNDDYIVVFENNVERDIFGPHCALARQIQLDLNKIVHTHPVTDIFKFAVDLAFQIFNNIAQIHFAEAGEPVKQKIFETFMSFGPGCI